MSRPAVIVVGMLAGGCVMSGSAPAPSPRSPDWDGPVVVRVPDDGTSEEMLNLPEGALTSEAALVSADASTVCFDVKMRTWQGASPEWEVTLAVDGAPAGASKVFLRPCTGTSLGPADRLAMTLSCLPVDTSVGTFVTDSREVVQVRGERICLDHGGRIRPETETTTLALKQGAASFEFVWQFAGGSGE